MKPYDLKNNDYDNFQKKIEMIYDVYYRHIINQQWISNTQNMFATVASAMLLTLLI